jgi:acetoin utilization deacetylase AcuC-like enzyme
VASCGLDARAERRLGFPQSPALVRRSRASVGGTVAAARSALDDGFGVQLAGGTHHAFRDRGEGFCVYNDLVVAAACCWPMAPCAASRSSTSTSTRATAPPISAPATTRMVTYSLHGDRNYPFVKERSDLDVPLPDGTGDAAYLDALDATLPPLLRLRPGPTWCCTRAASTCSPATASGAWP